MVFAFDIVSYLVHSKLRTHFRKCFVRLWNLKIVGLEGVGGILYPESFYIGVIVVYLNCGMFNLQIEVQFHLKLQTLHSSKMPDDWVDDEIGRMSKEIVMAYFEVLPQHMHVGTE